jgi:hypothetical protein
MPARGTLTDETGVVTASTVWNLGIWNQPFSEEPKLGAPNEANGHFGSQLGKQAVHTVRDERHVWGSGRGFMATSAARRRDLKNRGLTSNSDFG